MVVISEYMIKQWYRKKSLRDQLQEEKQKEFYETDDKLKITTSGHCSFNCC